MDAEHQQNAEFERRVLRFEQAWQQGTPPAIPDFLEPSASPAARLRLLRELVCIDFEYRWRQADAGQTPPLLEDYLQQFPELGPAGEQPLELIGEEYRVRRSRGENPRREDYLARFGKRREAIARLLGQIDQELEAETDTPPGPNFLGTEITAVMFDGTPDPQAPLAYSDYVLKRLIGAGRMGKVYQAWQRSLDRPVAVKYLRKSFLNDRDAVKRFLTEARTIARLRHPGIVGVHGLGRTPSGGYFLVMDWIPGPDLAGSLQSRGPTGVANAVRWTSEACEAIEVAHRHGIIHCDLKPGNILLDEEGRIRVTDFGLARSLTDETRTDEGMEGTAPFMAPEQVSGYWGPITPRTDVYGLGAVLYTLLTGQPPWDGQSLADVLAQVVSAKPVTSPNELRPGLPGALGAICHRCLSKHPEQRFATVRELSQALKLCLPTGKMDEPSGE